MLTDAHCHPFNLAEYFPSAEDERRQLGVMCAASATTLEEFAYCEQVFREVKDNKAVLLLPCFAVHPQMPAVANNSVQDSLAVLETLASEGRLAAVGETGFDLYDAAFRETEKIQDELFAAHLETALRHDLPLVLHVRRAMHKIFAFSSALKKCKAVIFHSWPGTMGEGEALLRRGINVFFSFGNTIMLNHREAIRCCSLFPPDRLLAETDAPYQPLRGKNFSSYADLKRIIEAMAALRGEVSPSKEDVSVAEMENCIEHNFHRAFMLDRNFRLDTEREGN
jgi:TatD DNase family protein